MAVSAYAIFSDTPVFPANLRDGEDGRGAGRLVGPVGDPDTWTLPEVRGWLQVRHLMPAEDATREELVERVKLNMRRDRAGEYGAVGSG